MTEANTVDELVRQRIKELDEDIQSLHSEIEASREILARRQVKHRELVAARKGMASFLSHDARPTEAEAG